MPSNVRQLLDNGVPVYPITDKSLVIGLQDVPFESYVVAWDGASTPVPANIPAGVVVTYNTTDYPGTLAAGSATAPYLYLVASASQQGEYDRYIVTHTGSTYAWTQLGSTAPVSPVIADNLTTNDASKALSAKQGKILGEEVGELEAKVNNLANTRYYGIFTSSAVLPADASENGYAYVGSSTPLAIYEFDGEDWNDTGVTVNSIQGEPGADGVGFASVESPTPADGTVIITLSNGDTMTLDLNHNHPQYLKYVMLNSESEMPANPDSTTLYMWPEE